MKSDRALAAHLMRRAGFGATPAELDALTRDKTYEEIVDGLVNPEQFPELGGVVFAQDRHPVVPGGRPPDGVHDG